MDWRWDPAALVMLGTGAVMVALFCYVWPRRAAGGGPLLAMLAAVAQWSVAYGLELSAVPIAAKEAFGAAKYVGIAALPPAWLAFTLAYIGRERHLTRGVLGLLAVEPVVVLVLLALPETRELVRYYPADAAGPEHPVVGVGWFFWVHLVYTNVLLLAASGLFVVSLARVSRAYWREAAALIAATALPWVVNLTHNLNIAGQGRVDFTPPAFAVTSAVIVWGVFRRRLLGLSAIGRNVVVERMRDGMILVDAYGRIVDVNEAATHILGRPSERLLGVGIAQVVAERAAVVDESPEYADVAVSLTDPSGVHHDYEVTRGPLTDSRGHSAGELLLLRDVTERKRAERQTLRLLEERSRVARVLQDSLLPAVLPPSPGMELAARYRPAGDGGEVGGDFYDVFPLADGRWAMILGDVSGKGAEAAAMTALVRYTVRALASEPHTPREMLSRLSAAMLRQTADEHYCSAVYLIVEPHAAGARVVLALGGHPYPLLVRQGGHGEYVGEPGLVLGALDGPDLHDVHLDLGLGDLLCLYTDGVTEARRGRELFDDERLARCVGSLAPQSAEEVASGLEQEVVQFSETQRRDDIAIVVAKVTGY